MDDGSVRDKIAVEPLKTKLHWSRNNVVSMTKTGLISLTIKTKLSIKYGGHIR